jgi:hypothetical protein
MTLAEWSKKFKVDVLVKPAETYVIVGFPTTDTLDCTLSRVSDYVVSDSFGPVRWLVPTASS